MRLKNGTIYRFVNDYHDGYGLNIYGTGAGSIKGGQNVCLYPASSDDKMQQWKAVDAEEEADTFRLCAVLKSNYVLDCSDGSIATSYKNNAHMCEENGTSDADCALEVEPVGNNRVMIRLSQKDLYLTATTVAEDDTELSNNISTSAALRGGKEGRGNVYWKAAASEGSMTWKKQCWEVIEVSGGSEPEPEPEPDPGKEVVVTGMPSCWAYPNSKEYFHPGSGMVNGTWSKNGGAAKERAIKAFYKEVFDQTSAPNDKCLYNLFGAKYAVPAYKGKYHSGIDMNVAYGAEIHSAHSGEVTGVGGNYGIVAIYDEEKDVTYLYLHMDVTNTDARVGGFIKKGDFLGTQAYTGLASENDTHLHIEVRAGRQDNPAGLPTIDQALTSISPYNYL
ncbi:MAG: M23 family metallopeptidase [Clostridiales bacterium]|nr:M23 family metallopeptidase [Clostridiales bacterium]